MRRRLARLTREGVAHVIVDAIEGEDLVVIAEACQDMRLLTGGSALALPLAELWLKQGLVAKAAPHKRDVNERWGSIILSGSCSAMTNRQVASYLKSGEPAYRLDPLMLAVDGNDPVVKWLAPQPLHRVPIIYATAEPLSVQHAQQQLGAERAGSLVEEALAACAVAARDHGRRHFVVAGGETAGAVVQALGVFCVDVGKEIAPGVPWCFARSGEGGIALALKSGNFGGETFFARALEQLGV